ncbi:ABC transporter permease subunit [Niallia sp. 01092]|uniref:ABC transporter permease subunit n=1 Tax=unclassified Niallia TaxID=2837522 RepID=UPI003FD171F6
MKKKVRISYKILPWIVPVILLLLWHVLTTSGTIGVQTFPEPLKVLGTFIALVKSGELADYIGDSAKRAFSGFIIGGSVGLLLGLVNGLSSTSEKLLDSTIQMVRNIPHLALIPLVILWFGIAEPAKLVLISLGVFFPIYLNTFHGIRSIEQGLTEMGKVYNLNRFALFWHVILPGALPSILVGVRYSLGVMWLTLIVAETVAADSGIGYMAMNGREFMQMDVIVLSILIYAVLGKLSDTIAKFLEKRWLQWHPNFSKN